MLICHVQLPSVSHGNISTSNTKSGLLGKLIDVVSHSDSSTGELKPFCQIKAYFFYSVIPLISRLVDTTADVTLVIHVYNLVFYLVFMAGRILLITNSIISYYFMEKR